MLEEPMEDIKKAFGVLGDDVVIDKNNIESIDNDAIDRLSTITGVNYSDEQLKIMKHHGGMAIMAAAGSGKTTVLTHLIAKRIITGEIPDTSKVLCTTYSKAGADEMEERINKLLNMAGIKKKIMVKTMHAFYLLILQHFGYSLRLVDNMQRTRFIREACAKVDVKLNDDELQTLDSLLSYQVNNLLSDKDLFDSYVYTLENVPIDKYTQIHGWYTNLKKQANMMDFDDMQLYVYFWLCASDENTKKVVKDYIQQTWNEFYIDEAQDLSKIQMAILRKMCTDSSKIVFIGDDDQCLVKGTKVSTPKGLVNIEDISVGDEVYTSNSFGKLIARKVSRVSRKNFKGNVVRITTSTGKVVTATPDHTGFVELDNDIAFLEGCTQFNKYYSEIDFINIQKGMFMPVSNDTGRVESEAVESVKLIEYNDYVYDVSVPATRNFVANGVIVHNCIYEWRGADPSLLINITGYYDIERFILSTNYRCKAEIVDTAAVGIKYNTRRTDKTMKPFNSGGEIKIIDATDEKLNKPSTYSNTRVVGTNDKSPDLYHMTKYAFLYIRDLIKSGVKPSDIAVLSRNNNQLSILNNMLFREGIYSSYTTDMKFTNNGMYKEMKSILELAKDECEPNLTQNILWKVVPYFSAKNAKVLSNFQESSGMCFSDTLGYFLTNCCNMQLNWSMPSGCKVPATAKTRLNALARSLNTRQSTNLAVMYKATVYDGSTESDPDKRERENEYRRLANYFGLYSQVSLDFLYRTEDKQRTCKGYIEYFKKMVKDWGIHKTLRFLNVAQQYENGTLSVFDSKVNMSTMHGAKGKEWKHVILFADDNVTFPNFRSLYDLKRRGISKQDIFKVIEEERRLHYVAMTRAKECLAIITYAKNISVYTLEALGLLKTSQNNEAILKMALDGQLTDKLKESAKLNVFTDGNKYYTPFDISKIEEVPDIEFYGSDKEDTDKNNVEGISLDDMMGASVSLYNSKQENNVGEYIEDDDPDEEYRKYMNNAQSIDAIDTSEDSGVSISFHFDDEDDDFDDYM